MKEKENIKEQNTATRFRQRKNKRIITEGNDYVLKRYRLQQNQHFKDKTNDENQYEITGHPFKKQNIEQEPEQDLVIVSFDSSPTKGQAIQPTLLKEKDLTPSIYVFDDEQLTDNLSQTRQSGPEIQKQVFIQRKMKRESKIERQDSQCIKVKNKDQNLHQFGEKASQRSNNLSNIELNVSSHFKLNTMFMSLDQQRQLASLKKKVTKKLSGLQNNQSLQGVEFYQGQDQSDLSINIVNKRVFSISKLPNGIILKCLIKRTTSLYNLLSPEYDLYLANGLKHIISAKKFPMRNRQLFKFSNDFLKFSNQSILSVMHANSNHNIYWLLEPPNKVGQLNLSFVELVVGYYRINSNQKQRKFTVLLPTVNEDYQLAIDYQRSHINFSSFQEEIRVQINNLLDWPDQVNNSTKNFVLADKGDQSYRYLQMKKQSDNVFELEIRHPLSPLQAMAIAMTRFDAQLK